MHLAIGDHRVDDDSRVLRHQEFLQRDAPGLNVHFDNRDMAGIGKRAGRVIGAVLRQAGFDFALE